MKEIYYLNTKEVPTIPLPHDCIINEIKLEDDKLTFIFEEDISYHDGIREMIPNVKSLIVRFHLLDDIYDIEMFVSSKTNRFLHKTRVFKEIDLIKNRKMLANLANTKTRLEYLYHNVGYCSIIVKLWSAGCIVLDISADFVEFDWIEK